MTIRPVALLLRPLPSAYGRGVLAGAALALLVELVGPASAALPQVVLQLRDHSPMALELQWQQSDSRGATRQGGSQFSCRRLGSSGLQRWSFDRDGHDARVNYVGGSLISLETPATAAFEPTANSWT